MQVHGVLVWEGVGGMSCQVSRGRERRGISWKRKAWYLVAGSCQVSRQAAGLPGKGLAKEQSLAAREQFRLGTQLQMVDKRWL